jgi:hypothetical protein
MTIPENLISRKIGCLSEDKVKQVESRIDRSLGIP